jgi:ribosomal protein S11
VFDSLTQAATHAAQQVAESNAAKADLGATWTNLMVTVTGSAPDALTAAREAASRMLGRVR